MKAEVAKPEVPVVPPTGQAQAMQNAQPAGKAAALGLQEKDGKNAPAASNAMPEGSHLPSNSQQQALPPSNVNESTTECKRSVEESAADEAEKKGGESSSQTAAGGVADKVGRPEGAPGGIPLSPAPSPKRSRSLTNVSRADISGKSQSADKSRDSIPFSGVIEEPDLLSAQVEASALRQSLISPSASHASTTPTSPVTPERGPKAASRQGRRVSEPGSSRGSDENTVTDVEALREAVQAERARADQAQQNHEALLELMRMAEGMLAQHTGEGMSGVTAIYKAANGLVSSDMLLHLPLSKAHMLANLQVEIKMQANKVLEALATMNSLTRPNQTPPGRSPREVQDRPASSPRESQPKE